MVQVSSDPRVLRTAVTDTIIRALHCFDGYDAAQTDPSAFKVESLYTGGPERYLNDAMFRAKVDSMVAQLGATLRVNGVKI